MILITCMYNNYTDHIQLLLYTVYIYIYLRLYIGVLILTIYCSNALLLTIIITMPTTIINSVPLLFHLCPLYNSCLNPAISMH